MEVFGEKPIERSAVNIHRVLEHVRRLAQSGFAAHIRFQENYDPVAAAGLGQPRPAGAGRAEPGEERRRGGHRTPATRIREIVLTTGFQHGMRLAVPGSTDARRSAAVRRGARQRPGHPRRHPPASVRAVRHARKATGSGLGLALVAKIVGDHGGLIEVDSRPGRTEFRLHLPVVTDEEDDNDLSRVAGERRVRVMRAARITLTLTLSHFWEGVHDPPHRPRRRRRPFDPHRADPGAGPLRLPGAQHRQRRDAVALGGGRRGRPGHHRRGDAGRERPRPDPAHQAHPPRPARGGDERAIDADDRGQGGPARRLRIPAQAVRPAGTAGGGRPRAGGPAPSTPAPRRAARRRRAAAADRPQPGDAGDLPHHRPAHAPPT